MSTEDRTADEKPTAKQITVATWKKDISTGGYVAVGINKDDRSDTAFYLEFFNGCVQSKLTLRGESMQELVMLYMAALRYRTAQDDVSKGVNNFVSKWLVEGDPKSGKLVAKWVKKKFPNKAKGGKARAEKLNKERRKEIAKLGAAKRWNKKK